MSHIQCAPEQLEFQRLGRRAVVAAFDGGTISSEGGALLLRELDRRSGILDRFTACFIDRRNAGYWEHPVRRLLAQRVYGLCLGYEDLNDHEQLRYDPLFATLCEQHDPQGVRRHRVTDIGKALAGKATLQRLESTPASDVEADRYHKISHEPERVRQFFIEHVLRHYNRGKRAKQIVIDLDGSSCLPHRVQDPSDLIVNQRDRCIVAHTHALYVGRRHLIDVAEVRSGSLALDPVGHIDSPVVDQRRQPGDVDAFGVLDRRVVIRIVGSNTLMQQKKGRAPPPAPVAQRRMKPMLRSAA